jgi:RHS repeat-associated protein
LFSGEFHESVVDLRIPGCSVGLDLVWARRYRSRVPIAGDRARLGNGWDHGYNIHIDARDIENSAITIHDGNARPAVFTQNANGSWTAPRYHRSGEFDAAGRFVLTFADGGQWIFESSGEIRKLQRIVDRNQNTVEFEYDAQDRLERVVNAVGQSLELEYDGHGRIGAVVAKLDDQTERRVTYEYYGIDDPRGNHLDLRRVTSPTLTTSYTYSTNSGVPELDGNLLTIADSLGRVYLRNTYAATTDPADLEFDRLIAQDWGDAGDTLSLTYARVVPSAENGFAVTKAWLNDRVGRVSEHFFDADNQRVMLREYTGFADPGRPTDDGHNQPEGKLRPADPTYFETRYRYDVDGHVDLVIHPRGNATVSVYESDLDPEAPARTRGNLRERRREGLDCDDDFATIRESYEYAPGLGNEHGEIDFVTRFTDPRGFVTESAYDSAGNRTAIIHPEPNTREDMEYSAFGQLIRHRHPEDQHGSRREVVHTYADDGRLRETIVDPAGIALRTTSEYDAACNEVRRVDPRGNDELYVYDERDQLIREWSPLQTCSSACGGGAPTRAYTDRTYDANMHLIRVDHQALECDGKPQANEVLSTFYEYDILGEVTAIRTEVAPDHEIVERFELDANREVIAILQGEATAGNDPDNVVTMAHDERGLLFRESRGGVSTIQHDHDLNGNETALFVGLEGPTRTTTHAYDCADRLIATVDPMGNRGEFDHDAAGNIVERRMFGELLDLPGSSNNVLLERVTNEYDGMNRVVETIHEHFDPATQATIGDGQSVTTFAYDGESRVFLEVDDNGHGLVRDFDAAGRLLTTIDAVGNTVDLGYDANGNVITRTATDVPTGSGVPLVGVWTNVYDAQDNLIEAADPLGNAWHNCYDSLGNLRAAVDPRGIPTRHVYDGADRLLETTMGIGAEEVRISQTWDDSHRLVAREDPNGNVTRYAYDSLNRPTTETFADGTTSTFEYDVHDNVVSKEDANGTILTTTYDGLERPIEVDVEVEAGVYVDTAFESFAWDARSLLVRAADDDSAVFRTHDSLGALLSETQTYVSTTATPHEVRYARDGMGGATTTRYPGGRRIDRTFDGLRRTSRIDEDDAALVEIEYLGPNVHRRTYFELDTVSEYAYDLAHRMIDSRHSESGGGTIDHREYGFDQAGNKGFDHDVGPGSPAGFRQMQHDSLGRMTASDVSGSADTDRHVEYSFDGAGSRTLVIGDACPGVYVQESGDELVNQYTRIPCENWSTDAVGNLIESRATGPAGQDRSFRYDHRGRLVSVSTDPGAADEVTLEFAYDALGRKIHATRIDEDTIEGEKYVYDDWNVIEEYPDRSGVPSATYLYGDELDERLQMVRDESWWYFDDELGSTSAVARRDGDSLVIERYAYHDYGEPAFLAGPASGNPYLFGGARWLGDVGLYEMRTRYLDPTSGRFISRDSIGIWGDEENLGNGYSYVGNMPDTHTDPTGEERPVVKNCHSGAAGTIENALREARRIATLARDWFNREGERKRKARKSDWNKNRNDGRPWWGKYYDTRFHRIKWNFRKIAYRCQKDVITFKCRTTGEKCGKGTSVAWTHSVWGATIRLCKNNKGGIFLPDGEPAYRRLDERGGIVMHEVAHNINAIGDRRINGSTAISPDQTKRLSQNNPISASWNAGNYEQYARSR